MTRDDAPARLGGLDLPEGDDQGERDNLAACRQDLIGE
jgi:hypothetical protein